jgi:radical SAM/Cys-rich protein
MTSIPKMISAGGRKIGLTSAIAFYNNKSEGLKMINFTDTANKAGLSFSPVAIRTLWVNITRRCNQTCVHCHVEASPGRTEQMSRATIEQCLKVIESLEACENLDITGGAPELHPDFDYMVSEARKMGKRVIVRHNLTITVDGDPDLGSSKEYLPRFFAENAVTILASLPHYEEQITDRIRGRGVFRKSIESIRQLNSLGYGQPGSGLVLNLVHNCYGPVSLRERDKLQQEFKEALDSRYGLAFNSLMAVTNMSIGRFRSHLKKLNTLEEYTDKLKGSFSPEASDTLVCRYLVSVGCNGNLYDCDFNQALGIKVSGPSTSVYNLDASVLLNRKINFGLHCFGCMAGGGSS